MFSVKLFTGNWEGESIMKPTILKMISLICFASLFFSIFTGCRANNPVNKNIIKFKSPTSNYSCNSGVVSETDKYSLSWDSDRYCVFLQNKETGTIWSTIPYDFYSLGETEGFAKVQMESPFFLGYFDTSNSQIKESVGYVEACMNGVINSKKIENGIRVIYYLEDLQIRIPIDYLLTNDGFEVRVLINQIAEGENPVYSISLLPYLCSAKQNTDSYLFIPSGSGALMGVEETSAGAVDFYGDVYGRDLIQTSNAVTNLDQKIYMPVYGAKYNDKAITAIIDKGAEISAIEAKSGDQEIGYANAYATFMLRGTEKLSVTSPNGYKKTIEKYTDSIVDIPYVSVKYFIEDEKSDYIDMAKRYEDYLVDKYSLKRTDRSNAAYYLDLIGASNQEKNFLGISYNSLLANTTFVQAEQILKELKKAGGECGAVNLIGYGQSGVDKGEIAGGFNLARCLGSKKDFDKYCSSNDLDSFIDFDVLTFSKSGSGVRVITDSAKTISGLRAVQKYYLPTSYNEDLDLTNYNLLERSKIPDVIAKLLKHTDKNGVSGVSLTSLGNFAYSDYSSIKGYSKSGFRNLVINELVKLKKNKVKISFDSPNDYAAVYADYIIGSPTVSSDFVAFKQTVPFYQIVFRNITNISYSHINLSSDMQDEFLSAISLAIPPSYYVAYSSDDGCSGVGKKLIKYSSYSDIKNLIKQNNKASNSYYSAVADLDIKDYFVLSSGVIKTTFSDDSFVIVNKTNEIIEYDGTKVDAKDFYYSKSGR